MTNFLLVVAILLFILAMGMPVAFGLGCTSLILIHMFHLPVRLVGTTMWASLESFNTLSIPIFVIMSQFLLDGHVGDDLFDVMNTWVRHLPGGLAIGTIFACAYFAAITGSGAATAATIGMVAYPAMIKHGYNKQLTLGLLAAGGTLGILIPPSIPMIIYATVTEDSTGKLFMAGVVPGLLMTALFVCYAVYTAKHGGYTPEPKASWSERFKVTFKSLPGIFLPVLIIGGIYTGIFTPTEAASVGLVYTLFITMVVYRTIKFSDIPKICLKAVPSSCMIAIIICGALLFGRVMTYLKIPQALTAFVTENKLSAATFIIMMNLLMFVLGALLETVSVVLLTMPLVTPILHTLGVDTIWYGVLVTINMTMALISPPVGMNLYVINGLFPDVKMEEVIKGVVPFAAIIIVVLIIAGLFPQLSLWLPSMM